MHGNWSVVYLNLFPIARVPARSCITLRCEILLGETRSHIFTILTHGTLFVTTNVSSSWLPTLVYLSATVLWTNIIVLRTSKHTLVECLAIRITRVTRQPPCHVKLCFLVADKAVVKCALSSRPSAEWHLQYYLINDVHLSPLRLFFIEIIRFSFHL